LLEFGILVEEYMGFSKYKKKYVEMEVDNFNPKMER